MMKLGDVEDVIGRIRVGIDNRIRNDLPPDDRQERVFADVRDHHDVDAAVALEDAEYGDLAGCAAPASAFANPAKKAFIHLDKPFYRQAILQLPSDDLTEPMKEIGGRLAVDAAKSASLRAVPLPTKNSANRSCVFSFTRQPLIRLLQS